MIHELRPPVLEHDGLDGALQVRLSAVEGRAGLRPRLSPIWWAGCRQRSRGLYRIALEALNNALKHAHARTMLFPIQHDQLVTMEIADDGSGFDPEAVKAQAYGPARHAGTRCGPGGRLAVISKPGEGARLVTEVRI